MTLSTTTSNKGFYFGYFWACYASSQIFGNLLGALLIEKTTGPTFFVIMGSIMMVAITGFLFIKYPKDKSKHDDYTQIVNDSDQQQTDNSTVGSPESKGQIYKTLKLLASRKMLMLVP
jgi:hypothetical protein